MAGNRLTGNKTVIFILTPRIQQWSNKTGETIQILNKMSRSA